ncbi:MAG: protein translocase subunit SecF [bacterium]|nr:protein translocase subunit SecF [bacterium]
MFNIVAYKNIFVGFSLLLVIGALVSIGMFSFRLGIDFTGGTLWQVQMTDAVNAQQLTDYMAQEFKKEVHITTNGSGDAFFIRTDAISEEDHQTYREALIKKYPTFQELRFESIGPTIGSELLHKALIAFVIVLCGISLYIAFAFRKVSKPVSSWKYGIITLVTLFHDAVIPAGVYAALGYWKGFEIDTNFIVALLVIIGFSVHDTIVVFDRIRENLLTQKGKQLGEIINMSVSQIITRSVNTSLTLILVLIALFLFGAESLRYFMLLILMGTVVGVYSSIFVASPLLLFSYKK